jgi:hypothetical protein
VARVKRRFLVATGCSTDGADSSYRTRSHRQLRRNLRLSEKGWLLIA